MVANPRKAPPDSGIYPICTREPSLAEDDETAYFRLHELRDDEDGRLVPVRRKINSVRYAQMTIESLLSEKKALYREFAIGDWVLRKRVKRNKQEPWADGPFQIVKSFPHKVYQLRTINGQIKKNNYNADLLFPAYSLDGQPIDSPWYASKRLLEHHRRDIPNEANLDVNMPAPDFNLTEDASLAE